jgi:two-component system, OmpR family, response regulator
MRILVVEDDQRLADVLSRGLGEDGYTVDICADGDDVALRVESIEYDALILDLMLPGKGGLQVCRELRAAGMTTPILMLTARDTVDDIVAGLEAGADDYLTKPFAFRELRARLQSIMRRAGGSASAVLEVGDLVLDPARHEVRRGSQRIPLTNREYQLLSYLMHNRSRILTRFMIENHVWGYPYEGLSNTVDVHIKRLRRKLDVPGRPSIVETVRGVGYRLAVEGP